MTGLPHCNETRYGLLPTSNFLLRITGVLLISNETADIYPIATHKVNGFALSYR
jgi:hypothetical protein